jgi:RNA polymerase sigma-70 factor (ECF subfamily)
MNSKRGEVPEAAQDDRDLVKRMLAGEEHAFEEFFDGHFSKLYRFALTRMQDADAAEDVVQAALCKAISSLKSWRGEATLFTWLCTFCRHEISAHYRRNRTWPQPAGMKSESPDAGATLDSPATRLDPGPGGEMNRMEIALQVQSTLDDLPGRYGDALEWKYIQGLSVEEIAARLGMGAKAAESLLTRAREAFRKAFAAPGESPT